MPTYQYRCPSCGYEFEEFQSITEDPIAACPSCGGETRRIISGGAGFIFKGSGFYITDYKRKESSYRSESKDSGSSSESKPDSKPKASS